MRKYLLIILILWIAHIVKAQKLLNYDLANGLSSSEITSICKNDYYIWIATEDGLNRFDGHRFKIYKSDKNSNNCLKNNNIETLFLDSKGLLWIGFKTGGVDIYNPRIDQFTHLNELVSEPIPNRIISIFEDSDHNIWLGSWEEGVRKLIPNNTNTDGFTIEKSHWGTIVSSFVEKPRGYIWVSTYTGLIMYNSQKQTWKYITSKDQTITQIHDTGEDNTLYYSSWDNALNRLTWNNQPEDTQTIHLLHTKSPIYRIEGDKNKLLIGTWGEGIKVYDKKKEQIFPLPATENLATTFVNAMYKDNLDNLWIGSYSKGLYKYITSDRGIHQLLSIQKTHSPITSMALLNHKVLLGTLGDGIYDYDMQTSIKKESHKSNNKFKDHILSIKQNDDIILVGHDGTGLLYAFPRSSTGKIQWKEFMASDELEKITAFHIKNNKLWMGTKQNGLMSAHINRKKQIITDYVHYDSFSRDRINAILPYLDDQLFIASHNGLYLFNVTDEVILKKEIIDNEIVYSIIEDIRNKCWWIGTSNNMLKMELQNDSLQVSTAFSTYPLPQGAIKSLLLDNNDNLWFFIGEKLFCYISREQRICELDISYWGNSTILSAEKITYKDKQYIVFSNTNKLMIADIEKALYPYDKTKLILTDLEINHEKIHVGDKIDDRVILKENTEYSPSITLSYTSKWITLSFTEIGESNFINKYLYRMKAFSDTWQYLDISVPLTFSQLNPGIYTLEIIKYNDHIDNNPRWSMSIIVTPPWWKTPLVYFILTLLIFLGTTILIYSIIRHYRKKSTLKIQEMETLKKEEILKEKEGFFQSIGHDLITPLSLILAPANDMLRETKENDIQHERLSIITKNATFLSDLFSTILDFKQVEFSEMKIKNRDVEIVSFCQNIINAFNYLASSKNIQLSYKTNISSVHILIDSVKVERILYNLLSNAIKYTPEKGSVSALLEYADGQLSICIKDTGFGINHLHQQKVFNKFYREPQFNKENSPKGLGIGLYVVKKFVSVMNGTIAVDSYLGQGTTLCIKFPVETPVEHPKQAAIINLNTQNSHQENHVTILLVEDNDQILRYLSSKLADHFNVVTAANGEEALKCIAEYLPEIVISDIIMPGIDGLALCRRIKESTLYSDIFVILLTAKTSSEDELKGYKEGADIYIKKPFDSEALINQIMNILNTRQKRKEQFLKSLIVKDSDNIEFNSKEVFLQQAMKVIEENLDKADFNIEEFATAMNTSKTVLHKKFRMLIGQTPNQFIRAIRLRKASELLINSDFSISEIAYLTGFNQAHYFIKCFKDIYNETPKGFRDLKKGAHQ